MAQKDNIKAIKDYLELTYGEVKQQWLGLIQMLADNLALIENVKKSIKENGVYDNSTSKKNPLLSTLKDLQATNLKIYKELGVTPWAASKIKLAEEDDTEDFVDNLTNEQ